MGSRWIRSESTDGTTYVNLGYEEDGPPDLIAPFPDHREVENFDRDLCSYSKIGFERDFSGDEVIYFVRLWPGGTTGERGFVGEKTWYHLLAELERRIETHEADKTTP